MIEDVAWPAHFFLEPRKITAYLLNPSSRDGAGKCKFLAQFGFTPHNPRDLWDAIHRHRIEENFGGVRPGFQAVKLYFDGPLISIGIDRPYVRTVWQIDDADRTRTARFITRKPSARPDIA